MKVKPKMLNLGF